MTVESSQRDGVDIAATPSRTGRHRSRLSHVAIMTATNELLQEIGYNRLTIERVAARAGVGKTTVYRWWPNKSRLVLEAVGIALESPPVPLTGDSRSDVRALVQRIADTFTSPLGAILPALVIDLTEDPDSADHVAAVFGPQRAADAAVLYDAAGRGDLPHDIDAHLLLDMVRGTIVYRCLLSRGGVNTNLVDQLTALVLDGISPRLPDR